MLNLPINIDFSGKVVVVTGAGGLICGAMAWGMAGRTSTPIRSG